MTEAEVKMSKEGGKDKGKMPSKASESNSKGKGKSKATGQGVGVADDSGQSKLEQNDPSTKKGSSNSEIIQLLKTIQQSQTAQGERIDKLSGRVDDLYNYNYEQYDDDVDEYDEDVLLYGQSSNRFGYEGESDGNNNEPPSKIPRTDTDNKSPGGDNVFTNAGKKLRVKELCDKDLNQHLAHLVDSWFQDGIEDERYTELLKENLRPENCASLVTVKTNQLIWDLLSPPVRTNDKKIQNAQTSVVKAAVIMTKVLDKLGKKESDENSELINQTMQSLALLGQSNRQLCLLRRELMKPDMRGEYSHMCSQSLKFTDHLFGDDVPKAVKDISDCSKLSNKLSNQSRGRGRYFRGRGRFVRGFRGPPRGRGYGTYNQSGYSSQYGAHGSESKNYKRGLGRTNTK